MTAELGNSKKSSSIFISYLFNCSYYINHYTKTTSWEDPRERYKEIGKPTGKDNKENEVETVKYIFLLLKVLPTLLGGGASPKLTSGKHAEGA